MVVAREPKGGKYLPAPAGIHKAVCADVVDLGYLESNFGKLQHKIQIRWFLDELLPADKIGPDGIGHFMVSSRLTNSLHEKATLRKILTAWRGKPFSKDELTGFDLENIVGASCQVVVTHNVKDDATYANVEAVAPLAKGMEKMAIPEGYVRAKDRPDYKTPFYPEPEAGNGEYTDAYFDAGDSGLDEIPF